MITEDYVSFEVAKLLEEKGFNRVVFKNSPHYAYNADGQFSGPSWDAEYPAPTLQMAMKWLREKNLVICVIPLTFYGGETVSTWGYNIWANDNLEIDEFDSHKFATYEEAAESAIKYCLEKLI
jgi:hypothetical protein